VQEIDEKLMRHWSDRCSNFLFQPVAPDKDAMAQEQREILDAQQAYFMPRIEERRREPGEDMISAMARANVNGERLTDLEILATCNMMATAGGGTSRSAIAMSLWWLHQFPDQLAKLKAEPSLIDLAAEEFLRYDSSVQMTGRVALEDIDDLGCKKIPKGEAVLCLLGSANRDPAVYPDRPDRLDITRPNVRPLSFGGGIHFCLGAQLARIEAEVAIATLLRRLPELRLDDAQTPNWRPTFVLRGLKTLPASW